MDLLLSHSSGNGRCRFPPSSTFGAALPAISKVTAEVKHQEERTEVVRERPLEEAALRCPDSAFNQAVSFSHLCRGRGYYQAAALLCLLTLQSGLIHSDTSECVSGLWFLALSLLEQHQPRPLALFPTCRASDDKMMLERTTNHRSQ